MLAICDLGKLSNPRPPIRPLKNVKRLKCKSIVYYTFLKQLKKNYMTNSYLENTVYV